MPNQPATATVGPRTASLTSRAYQQIRDAILSGALEPGRKLKIEDLRQRFGTGASPLREALSLLTSDRLVERIDQRGFRVAHASAEQFDELLKTRYWLEDRALRESIANGDTLWAQGVVDAGRELAATPRSAAHGSFVASEQWEAAHRRFHAALISACGSSLLLRFCGELYVQNIRYRNLAGPGAYPRRDVNQEHALIASAALARDADRAVALLREHYARTGEFLKANYRSAGWHVPG